MGRLAQLEVDIKAERQKYRGWKCAGKNCDACMPNISPRDGGLDKYCAKCALKEPEVSEAHKQHLRELNASIDSLKKETEETEELERFLRFLESELESEQE